ncbi:MAG: hypothetical protein GY903_02285 [Fuerstiella sp.]|nr:hypothetical protein [Fuerstiella sp.]MCP4853307.1 hypothetical protein [Fuerstiella sp.]
MFAQQRGRMAASYFRDKVVRVLLEKAEVLFRKTHARQHMLASTSSPAHRRQHDARWDRVSDDRGDGL